MPILRSSPTMILCACLTSIHCSGPRLFVGSEPRKKLRQIDMSGTVARSWKTVAIPRSFASRGELKRTGSPSTNGSGDYCIAFSTAPQNRIRHGDTALRRVELLPNDSMSPLFLACVEATEEAVYNSLLRATTITGRNGTRIEARPIERTIEILKKYRALQGGR